MPKVVGHHEKHAKTALAAYSAHGIPITAAIGSAAA